MIVRYCTLVLLITFLCITSFSQVTVLMPSSIPLTVDFGNGVRNPGPPLNTGYSDFSYTDKACPLPGEYTIVNKDVCFNYAKNDAGHIFFGPHPLDSDTGYMMVVSYDPNAVAKIVFSDTLKNLCSSNKYLFWAAIDNLSPSTCYQTNLSFNIETVYGQIIQSFQTGNIGGTNDNYHPYFGVNGFDERAAFPHYYGGVFTLPPGINNVVIKIVTDTEVTHNCVAAFAIDNIQLSPVGTGITIEQPDDPGAWLISTCYKGDKPLILSAGFNSGYYDFNTQEFIHTVFANPAVQWQQSLDNGYTWTDISGETNLKLSKKFSNPDTFYVRLRASENDHINNANCSVTSNIIQVNVDSEPKNFDITSNSPVCEDSDIVLNVSGGTTYTTTGPNGFYDNSPFPHVYHPVLADSGWYKTKIFTQGGCDAEDSTFVKVIGPDLTTSFYPDNVCYGKPVQLSAAGAKTYVWTPSTYLNYVNIANPVARPLVTTKYQVQATDDFGCSAFDFITVHVKDTLLKANFLNSDILCPNDIPSFTDTSIGAIAKWSWSFGNGETSQQKSPSPPHYNFLSNTAYPVQLIVTDTAACADTITKLVKTVTNCFIAVPTAFTPNNDGLNDYLYPINAYKATNLSFKVFNRFGKIVFQTKNWTKKWDGTLNGFAQPTGTYIWILTYDDENKRHVDLKGTTVLIR